MQALAEKLASGDALLADGALGTMLIAAGLAPGACPEEMVLTRPEVVGDIARAYAAAGADLVQTNTFGGSPLKLAGFGLADRAAEINRRAVEIARSAVGGRAFVVASLGPTGRILRPYGDAEPDEVARGFAVQAGARLGAGADGVSVETMIDPRESVLALRALKAISPATPVICTLTFERTPRGFFTIMGTSVDAACRTLAEAGADAVGANCGAGSASMVEVAAEFRRRSTLPVAIRPNAGLPQLSAGSLTYPETPAEMAARIGELLALGVSIVGGCCGTTPDHIRAFRAQVDAHNARRSQR